MDSEPAVELGRIEYARVFPWVHLFRAFRIAIDPRKLLLAALGVILLALGNWLIAHLPFAPEGAGIGVPLWPASGGDPRSAVPLEAPVALANEPEALLTSTALRWGLVLQPVWSLLGPALTLFDAGTTWSASAYAWTRLLWALAVWAFIGGAITRMAAVHFARDERVGVLAALKFAAGKFLSYLGAPLPAIAGLLFLWLLCAIGGLIGRIPGIGEPLVGLFFFVPLLLALAMTFLVLVLAFGWPLMLAAVSTEGSDAFDGLSRASSYVLSRPWYYLWSAIVAMVYGAVVISFVALFASTVAYLAGWGLASGMGTEGVGRLYQLAPGLWADSVASAPPQDAPVTIGARLAGLWLGAVGLMVGGFVYSYFWTASTIIYFLLRHREDAADYDEVYLPETDEPDPLLPLVGVAASEQPVIERPVTREEAAAQRAEAPDKT
jgi:hypothetical protein